MIKIVFFKIDHAKRNLYRKLIGPYTFPRCSCGCTKSRGIGCMFWWFGVYVLLEDEEQES